MSGDRIVLMAVYPFDKDGFPVQEILVPLYFSSPETYTLRYDFLFLSFFGKCNFQAIEVGEFGRPLFYPGNRFRKGNNTVCGLPGIFVYRFIVIEEPDGRRIGVVQIAGLVARRIVPFVGEGATVSAGERIGMIRFGSRLDVYLPEGTPVLVAVGQQAVAGETIIADRGGRAPFRQVRTD